MAERPDSALEEHYDKLRMSAWLHQMSAVWSLHRYAALVEAGAVSGWYFLTLKGDQALAAALLLVSSSLLYLMILTIKRHAQMLEVFRKPLEKSGVIPKDQKPPIGIFGGDKGRLYAHEYARLFIAFLIVVNTVLAFFTLSQPKQQVVPTAIFSIAHAAFFWAFWGRRGTSILRGS